MTFLGSPSLLATTDPFSDLRTMLSFARPSRSVHEEAFIDRYIRCLPGIEEDPFGNLILDTIDFPTTLWSSHTDTVHQRGGFQPVQLTKGGLLLLAEPNKKASCLGADCTTGVWLMLSMIKAGVPGRYIFHRDEEGGGLGSEYIAKHRPQYLQGINHAIALDRSGTDDVITYQGSRRTASDAFADAFANILGKKYKRCSLGLFTDTKKYVDVVPECTNISVGYSNAHSVRENQDLEHALWLRDRLTTIDVTKLPYARNPKAYEYKDYDYAGWRSGTSSYGSSARTWSVFQHYLRENVNIVEDLLWELHMDEDATRGFIEFRKAQNKRRKELYDANNSGVAGTHSTSVARISSVGTHRHRSRQLLD